MMAHQALTQYIGDDKFRAVFIQARQWLTRDRW
jgi:hypothetical protein